MRRKHRILGESRREIKLLAKEKSQLLGGRGGVSYYERSYVLRKSQLSGEKFVIREDVSYWGIYYNQGQILGEKLVIIQFYRPVGYSFHFSGFISFVFFREVTWQQKG